MKTEYNLDINPKEETWRPIFPNLDSLFTENPLRMKFALHESAANSYKKTYWRFTRFAIFLIFISLICGLGVWVFEGLIPKAKLAATIAGIMGAAGIVIQLFLMLTKTKQNWLLNRYATERLRSFIATQFLLGASASTKADLVLTTKAYSAKCLAVLESELNTGMACLRNFQPEHAVILPDKENDFDQKIFDQSLKAYEFLRVDFQKKFIEGELTKLAARTRWQNSIEDLIFIVGIILVVTGLFSFNFSDGLSRSTIFLSAILFFLSAALAIIGQGTSTKPHHNRYSKYLEDIKTLGKPNIRSHNGMLKRVVAMEAIALRELDLFCQQIDNISIRI